jgi:hypothetical protein
LALAALRRLGYRAPNRRLVFEALVHSTPLDEPSRRVLIKGHEWRNFAEYEGIHDIDDRLLDDLIKATGRLLDTVRGLTPPEPEV